MPAQRITNIILIGQLSKYHQLKKKYNKCCADAYIIPLLFDFIVLTTIRWTNGKNAQTVF